MPTSPIPQEPLKEMFSRARFESLAGLFAAATPRFDRKRFLNTARPGLEDLALLQRMRRASESLHASLDLPYLKVLPVLRKVAPRISHSFVSVFLCDFIAQYGRDHLDESLEALRELTAFGSAEFAIRKYLLLDLDHTLRTMRRWARDPNEHVRRLASEGSRPRLPWGRQVPALRDDPELAAPILETLMGDPSLYVRKSVANHLNDHSRQHPDWVLAWLGKRDLSAPNAAWVAKHALRTLVKRGHPEALRILGVTGPAQLKEARLKLMPARIQLGETLKLAARIVASGRESQPVLVDYAIHYVRQKGTSRKVFKWTRGVLPPDGVLEFTKSQRIQDFTTRKHHPGRHEVELLVNGETRARAYFNLVSSTKDAAR